MGRDRWNFRCRQGLSSTLVEVLRGVAMEVPDLAWVLEGERSGKYEVGLSLDHVGPMTIRADGSIGRAHIRPGEDPLLGSEPMAEVPGPIPSVILVPIAEWDAWSRSEVPHA